MAEGINGFSSPRADVFPAGLRVLVVDDDPTWLKILEKMLKKCSYEVTTCGLAIEALDLLRERKDGFDIVISDVNMPDMDGFKLLEHVGLEMELPVIMMSVDGETSRVMRGVQHGACDYLLKPIRMKELRNIWQHVYRKKIHEVRDSESHECLEEILMMRNVSEQSDDGYLLSGGDITPGKKRKDAEHNNYSDKDFIDQSSIKKARVVWTVDLHQKFVKAVNHIGFEKVGPKKILDLMNVPWLTRENVASHLQKYRLYLTRLQKDDLKSTDSIKMQQNEGVQNTNSRIHEVDLKVTTTTTTESKKVLTGYAAKGPGHHNKASSSNNHIGIGIGNNHSFGSTQYPTFNSVLPTQYSWDGGFTEIQFKQEHKKQHFEEVENGLGLLLPTTTLLQQHNQETGKRVVANSNTGIKSSFGSSSSSYINIMPTFQPPDPWSLKDDHHHHQTSINNLDLSSILLQGQQLSSTTNLDIQKKGVGEYNDPELPPSLYDALRFDYEYEYPPDSLEYPVIDQGLFIV